MQIKPTFLVKIFTGGGFVVCLAIALLFAGCKKKAPAPPPPPKVTVARPVQKPVTDSLDLTGTTQAVNSVQLVARVPGYLEEVFFKDGEAVRKGQRLFRIQQNTYQYALEQAEGQILLQRAKLTYANEQLVRYTRLLEENATSAENLENWRYQRDSAAGDLRAAVAARDAAKLNLAYTEVFAPFNGRIDRKLQDVGNLVGTASTNNLLAQIYQMDPITVYFSISDADLARLRTAANRVPGRGKADWPLSVGLRGDKGYPYKGRVDFASAALSPTTGTLLMRGVIRNDDGTLLPGQFARVRVPLETRTALLVPSSAVSSDQQGSYVMVVDGQNKVQRRNVTTGPRVGELQSISGGLGAEEWVITTALLRATPGRQVTPVRAGTQGK